MLAGKVFALICLLFGASLTQGCGGTGNVAKVGLTGGKLTLDEVKSTMEAWAKAANNRDIDATVALYDPDIGRLLGTVDEASSPRRTNLAMIRDYFNGFLGLHSAVVPNFPKFDPADVLFLADGTASYSGYYVFALTKPDLYGGGGDITKDVHAKFTYILRKTPNGVKIVLHNSLITPKGAVPRKLQADSDVTEANARHLESMKDGPSAKTLTLDDVQATIKLWTAAAAARDIDATVALYHPEMPRLLGTVDEASSPRRNTPELIREYFNGFLGGNDAVKPKFPKFDPAEVIFLATDTAAYSGYYNFELTKAGVTKEVFAKFTYILRKTPNGVKIVTHTSGLTPTGAVEKKLSMWSRFRGYFAQTGYVNPGEIFPEDGLLMDEGVPVQNEFIA